MKCNVAVVFMHDYLDGDLAREEAKQLQEHLGQCPSCYARYESLERTDAFVRTLPIEKAPEHLADRIMKSLPSPRRPAAWTSWVRRHPAVSAAAIFMVVMLSSFVAMWNQDQELSVTGPDLEHVVIEGNKVIVPEGQKFSGDLTVVNGDVQVLGDLDGNLTVIDGNVSPLASTAHIAGEIKTIDRAVDWMWYKVSSWFGTLAYGS
ncbi:zf-HC2 domain-containing protein [Cohnella silvisoli]|uniref:Anti-sigma-W factor RsiW n=1 Tax=Cohnella silvisoli TaxID=2873699 RepID=A0ABV1L2U8_9BACL|nr:zf-HC2 domain-containing protein [Cohnella silvisoli]MCD9025690.1 zf-HC2 domain-containing protein [Cohnella silvisoli]